MLKAIITLILILLIPSCLDAAYVLIWEYDTLDIFYDPVLAESVDCVHSLQKALLDNGHTYVTYPYLPTELNPYDVIFVTLGWYRCWGDNSRIAPAEQDRLIEFLQSGKGLYIEGTDFGSDNSNSNLYAYFGCNLISNGNSALFGNVRTIFGQPTTIVEGIIFNYLYQEGPDHYVDAISSNGGTIFFIDQNDTGRAVYYSGPNNSYRTIHSTLIFGALKETLNTRNELMARYMNYLTGLTNLIERNLTNPKKPNYPIAKPNPFWQGTQIFWYSERPTKIELRVYDRAGKQVKELFYGKNELGFHIIAWNGKDNYNRTVNPGIYFIQLKIANTITTIPLIRIRK